MVYILWFLNYQGGLNDKPSDYNLQMRYETKLLKHGEADQ